MTRCGVIGSDGPAGSTPMAEIAIPPAHTSLFEASHRRPRHVSVGHRCDPVALSPSAGGEWLPGVRAPPLAYPSPHSVVVGHAPFAQN